MIRIGITGGIGSGKSYVASLLHEQFGLPVYNCDKEAKRLNVESEAIRSQLIQLVGPEVYLADSSLNRQALANYLFADAEHANKVNAIVHPAVADDFRQWSERQKPADIVVMECAILFESGFDRLVDKVINVSAPTELCIERATRRDAASAEAIARRIQLQMGLEERNKLSDYIVYNDGRELMPQLTQILQELRN